MISILVLLHCLSIFPAPCLSYFTRQYSPNSSHRKLQAKDRPFGKDSARNGTETLWTEQFAFIVCQLPNTVLVLLSLHSANLLPCTFFIYSQIVVLASFAHSAVNLCICLAFSGNIEKVLKKFSNVSVSSPTQNAIKHTCVYKCT